MSKEPEGEELYFKCPKCNFLYSTTKSALTQDRYTKASLTRLIFGGKVSPLAYVPKCTVCRTKLERISPAEFQSEMQKPADSKR